MCDGAGLMERMKRMEGIIAQSFTTITDKTVDISTTMNALSGRIEALESLKKKENDEVIGL
jgi:hypothetical protein